MGAVAPNFVAVEGRELAFSEKLDWLAFRRFIEGIGVLEQRKLGWSKHRHLFAKKNSSLTIDMRHSFKRPHRCDYVAVFKCPEAAAQAAVLVRQVEEELQKAKEAREAAEKLQDDAAEIKKIAAEIARAAEEGLFLRERILDEREAKQAPDEPQQKRARTATAKGAEFTANRCTQ